MANQTVKNGLKAKKIKLPNFSFCKIFKKISELIQSYNDVPFSGPEWPICPEQIFLSTNHFHYFHLPIDTFHCVKSKKMLPVDPEL